VAIQFLPYRTNISGEIFAAGCEQSKEVVRCDRGFLCHVATKDAFWQQILEERGESPLALGVWFSIEPLG
jgi:hypothetical protein